MAWQLVVEPTSRDFTFPPLPICLPLPKVQNRLRTAALPSYTTLLSLSRHFLYSPSNSFQQFQLDYCCYGNDRGSDLPVCPAGRCTQPFLTMLSACMKYIKWNGIKKGKIFSTGPYRTLITVLKVKPAKAKYASTQDDLTRFCFSVPLTASENLSDTLYFPLQFMVLVLILVTQLPCPVSNAFYPVFWPFYLTYCIIKHISSSCHSVGITSRKILENLWTLTEIGQEASCVVGMNWIGRHCATKRHWTWKRR